MHCFSALQRLISGRFRKSVRGEGSTVTPPGGQGHFKAICAVQEEQDKGEDLLYSLNLADGFSYGQRSNYIKCYLIQTSSDLTIVSRTRRMSTWSWSCARME
jgi:hypothetical protein